ncbi:restriction endonuclease [Acinetobacter lwoffii]|uniref:restriction endonuclease n=1 Tax=Acinetobacter lwoffii TaxID=28090 RepID=UPI00209A6A65|nr:restriction endonuclease [Acinetobacter lwoffii]MCO8062144.1 restriction endonuclease [Acinetobacter lwoffii]
MDRSVGLTPIEHGFIGIGWSELGNLSKFTDRDSLKLALKVAQPKSSEASIRSQSSPLFRFINEMKIGDYVIYPSKTDRMIYVGAVSSDYFYEEPLEDDEYKSRRKINWITPNGIPRNTLSQSTLNELGAFITIFLIKQHTANEILGPLGLIDVTPEDFPLSPDQEDELNETLDDNELTTKAINESAKTSTEDFIIGRLHQNLNGYQFEEFIAHLLECMGYVARITQRSGDGGVDIIAHKDVLGFEPPIIKVQCKKTLSSNGLPEINQLLGTLGDDEYALFVNLGSYTIQARNKANNKSRLRLIDGKELISLIYKYYDSFSPQYRALIPLRKIFIPDLS